MEKENVKKLQRLLNAIGASPKLTVDGDLGSRTILAIEAELNEREPVPASQPALPVGKTPPWMIEARKYKGKKETDPEFNRMMTKKWALFGLRLPNITKSYTAWCGLAIATALAGVGVDYQKNGAAAMNWDKYGNDINYKVNGIPEGAIVRINHNGSCAVSTKNHVSFAEGDCSPTHLKKKGTTFNLYGGNQGNTWKVTTYQSQDICAVRWPKKVEEYPIRKIVANRDCTYGAVGNESTR